MTKRQDWAERLAQTVEGARGKAFVWGSHDCCTFALECVNSQLDEPVALPVGAWTNERTALRAIAEAGGLESGLDGLFTRRESPLLAQRGDVVLVDVHGRLCVAVCTGVSLVAPNADGLESMTVTDGLTAWKVA